MFLSVYIEDPNVTLLFQKNFWEVMGFNEKDRKWLYPEEALFLMEIVSYLVINPRLCYYLCFPTYTYIL